MGEKMAISYINTDEVENIANNISSQVNLYNKKIDDLFRRFSEVPTITREWVGTQSDKYFNIVEGQKKDFVKFGKDLQALVDRLNLDVADVRATVADEIKKES